MSVRKTKHHTYEVNIYNVNGKKISKRFKIKSDAVAFETKSKNEKRESKLVNSKLKTADVLFKQALEEFMNSKPALRGKTVSKYKNFIKQFILFLEGQGLKYISEFTPDHATLLLQELTKQRTISESGRTLVPKPKTVNGFLAVIKSFFNEEVVKGHIVKSPMLHIKNLKVQKAKPEFFTEEEIKKFFKQDMDDAYRLSFQGLLYTGMRIEELANIHWSDVDFERKLLKVARKPGFNPKTANSERAIPIADTLYKELCKLQKKKKSQTYVFTSANGKQIRERTLLGVCKRIATAAEITGRAFLHKFRHTYATHLVINRVPLERVQKLLGHSSINETLIYAHLIPDDMHDDVNVLDKLF